MTRCLVVLGVLGLSSCEPVDTGMLVSHLGTDLRPIVLPVEVVVDPRYEASDGPVVDSALGLWRAWERRDGVPRAWLRRAYPMEPAPRGLGQAYVTRGTLPEHVAAETVLDENSLGEVRWAEVTLSETWAWAESEQRAYWLAHELGHVLGLADDPGDLDESVMASPTRVGSRLTEHDFALLVDQ